MPVARTLRLKAFIAREDIHQIVFTHHLEVALASALSYGFFCFKQIWREFSCFCFYLYSMAFWIVVSADPPLQVCLY